MAEGRVLTGPDALAAAEALSYRLRMPVAAIVEDGPLARVYLWREPLIPHRDPPAAASRPWILQLAVAGHQAAERLVGDRVRPPVLARLDGSDDGWNQGRIELVFPAETARRAAELLVDCWVSAARLVELQTLVGTLG